MTCVHYLTDIDLEEVVDLFAKKRPTWHITERSWWSAANLVNNQIYHLLSTFSFWIVTLPCHFQISKYICQVVTLLEYQFEVQTFCEISTFRFWLPVFVSCRLQNARNAVSDNLIWFDLRTVPTIVTAHIFCACQGSRARRERNAQHAGHADWFCLL